MIITILFVVVPAVLSMAFIVFMLVIGGRVARRNRLPVATCMIGSYLGDTCIPGLLMYLFLFYLRFSMQQNFDRRNATAVFEAIINSFHFVFSFGKSPEKILPTELTDQVSPTLVAVGLLTCLIAPILSSYLGAHALGRLGKKLFPSSIANDNLDLGKIAQAQSRNVVG